MKVGRGLVRACRIMKGGYTTWENWATKWKKETSNWKEGTNLTVRVEELAEEHKLDNGEIFILIDNQVFEGCFYKGNYNSRKRNGLVLRLRLVEMGTVCILHVIHVAGTRMKNRA